MVGASGLRTPDHDPNPNPNPDIATQCVIIAGFAYDSLVEITISARMQERWGLGLGFGLGVAARLGFEAR